MATEGGSDASLVLLTKVTVAPFGPAEPVSVTVPISEVPPPTEFGFSEIDAMVAAFTVRVDDLGPARSVAVTLTAVSDETGFVEIGKVAVVACAATVTVAGTVAARLSVDRFTTSPPGGAACFNVIVPVEVPPP